MDFFFARLSHGQANSATQCPRVITRAEWKGCKPRSREKMPLTPVPYVVIHHGGIAKYCHDKITCSEIVRSYQKLHMDENHWVDIGYSFVIGEDGNIYEGRGWDNVGAHAPKYNNQSIGVCIIGDFTKFMPNGAALRALSSLVECGVNFGKISKDYRVVGHRQVRDTKCPGETFYQYVQSLPQWANNPVPTV
ncbi:peptidoglycan-recognition protein LB-like isoform X2 [Copidosoma floridanum]|uniref:peptidoglycan-recognition protein LB-like isoform X2 n=1 Tax=Copidosoma floridanum TaxID=29053 RepID=UPI0006C958DC|nr:peptidoglycan-recognition protein LB-like isoform X2 [Copidosoma floridanum]